MRGSKREKRWVAGRNCRQRRQSLLGFIEAREKENKKMRGREKKWKREGKRRVEREGEERDGPT